MTKDDFAQVIEKVLKGFNPSEDRMREIEEELASLKRWFWKHKHHKHGWEKRRVLVEANEFD